MGQSVTFRNFLGGFLGGALGILASWHIAAWALPIGVLLGVVIGWWHREFVGLFDQAHQQAKRAASYTLGLSDRILSGVARICGLPAWVAKAASWFVRAITRSVLAAVSAPGRLRRWLVEHPMNKVQFIHGIVLALIIGSPVIMKESMKESHMNVVIGLSIMSGWMMYRVHDSLKAGNEEIGKLNRSRRELEVISRYGSAGFFFYVCWKLIRCSLGLALFLAIAVSWFIVLFPFGFLGGTLFGSALYVTYGFYRLSIRSGHLLCLGVTLAVTGTSWYFFRHGFSDPRVLWSVALGTGFLSGAATELARLIVRSFYKNTGLGQRFARSLKAEADPIFDKGGYVHTPVVKVGGFWFRQHRVARAFRALCFNLPLAQPV